MGDLRTCLRDEFSSAACYNGMSFCTPGVVLRSHASHFAQFLRASANVAQTAPAVSVIVGPAIYLKFIGQGSHESKNPRTSRVEWACRRLEGSGEGLCHRVGGPQCQTSCTNSQTSLGCARRGYHIVVVGWIADVSSCHQRH